MSEVRDPAIKLFGRDIPVEPTQSPDLQCQCHISAVPEDMLQNGHVELTRNEVEIPIMELSSGQNDPPKVAKGIACRGATMEMEGQVIHKIKSNKAVKRDIDHQEKNFKKPDKVLPCPRCNSLETKFCYFNNYNVNQPRHFCKNCQRYWTAGGTIRNVPVGAGKRKNKHLGLQYSQLAVCPDVVSTNQTGSTLTSQMKLSSSGLPNVSRPIGGEENIPEKDAPLCESLETVLILKGQEKLEVDSSTIGDDNEEPFSSSSKAALSSEKEYSENGTEQVGLLQRHNGFNPLHSLHYYPVPSWAYKWSPYWNAMASRPSSITPSPAYMGSATMMTFPGFSAPTVELPVAPFYWGCLPSWANQKEESPLVGSTFSGIPSPSSSASNSDCSGNKSPTLGKHSRDASKQEEDTVKQNLWVPKTLRITDTNKAPRSSIWSTLIKPGHKKPIMKGGVFKSFEPKSDASSHTFDTDQILSANPAALSRLESFQERV